MPEASKEPHNISKNDSRQTAVHTAARGAASEKAMSSGVEVLDSYRVAKRATNHRAATKISIAPGSPRVGEPRGPGVAG